MEISTFSASPEFLGVTIFSTDNYKEENSVNDHNSSPNRVARSISSPARIVGTR